jgi:plastocyanin
VGVRIGALVVGVGVVLALGTACGSNGTVTGSSPPPASPSSVGVSATTPAPTGSPSLNCTDESSGSTFDLTMQNTAFHPPCVVARSAQSISIRNKDGILHNFSITGTSVDVDVQPGTTFNGKSAGLAPGTYSFFCKYHRTLGLVGTIVVK